MRCLSRALGRHTMLHGLTRDDIDRLPLPTIIATFGDPHASSRIHLKEWRFLHNLACHIPVGLKWRSVGMTAPSSGRELTNKKLSSALKQSTEFTVTDLESFELPEIEAGDYIKSGSCIFKQLRSRPRMWRWSYPLSSISSAREARR